MPPHVELDDDVELLVPEEEMVPEHGLHRVLVDLLAAGLERKFAGRSDISVFCRLAWFPDRSDTRIRLDPDVMVVRGRPPGMRKSYKAWVEEGVQPYLMIEVWSDDDTDSGYRKRLARARKYGVEEVVIIDPFAVGGCKVEHLKGAGERFRTVATSVNRDDPVIVASLGIKIAGGEDLYVSENSEPWPTTAEAFQRARDEAERANREAERADREAERADREAERADREAERADREAARAERLAAQLRELGVDPGA